MHLIASFAFQKNNNPSLAIPNPPKRSKSRSPSPQPPISNSQISTVLARLAEASEELRRYQRICDDEKDRDRMRRGGIRRAASTENDNDPNSRPSTRLNRHSQNGGSLYRKSLSLDQSMQAEQQQVFSFMFMFMFRYLTTFLILPDDLEAGR